MVKRRDTCGQAMSMRGIALATSLICSLTAGCATSTANPEKPLERTAQKAFVLPAVEIVAMDSLINLAGRQFVDRATYAVSLPSIRKNLRGPWVVDDDLFQVNQFLHPYQGAMYHD